MGPGEDRQIYLLGDPIDRLYIFVYLNAVTEIYLSYLIPLLCFLVQEDCITIFQSLLLCFIISFTSLIFNMLGTAKPNFSIFYLVFAEGFWLATQVPSRARIICTSL